MNEFKLTESNYHRLFFIAIVVASKTNEDVTYKNDYYAKVGGVCVCRLLAFERLFLSYIRFSLFVREEEYETYFRYIDRSIIKKKGN